MKGGLTLPFGLEVELSCEVPEHLAHSPGVLREFSRHFSEGDDLSDLLDAPSFLRALRDDAFVCHARSPPGLSRYKFDLSDDGVILRDQREVLDRLPYRGYWGVDENLNLPLRFGFYGFIPFFSVLRE